MASKIRGSNSKEFNPWYGQYGWQMYYIFAIEGILLGNFIVGVVVPNKMWLILSAGLGILLITVMSIIYVKKMLNIRDFVGGIDWLELAVVKDIDFIQDDRYGILDYSLLCYKIYGDKDVEDEEDIVGLFGGVDFSDEETVNWLIDYFKRKDRGDRHKKGEHRMKISDPEREKQLLETAKQIEEFVKRGGEEDETEYSEEDLDHHHVSKAERKLDEEIENVPIDKQLGEYVYICKLVEPTFFYDSVEHTFDTIILITNLPFGNQFKFAQDEIYQNGWWVNAKTTRATVIVDGWISPDRPIMRIDWSLAESLNRKRMRINQEPPQVHLRIIDILRAMVKNLRSKFERSDVEINELNEEVEKLQKLYSYELQRREYQQDDWLSSQVVEKGIMKMKRAVFLGIIIPLSLAFLGCLVYILSTVI